MHPTRSLLFVLLATITAPALAQTPQHGLRVPAGFEVTEYADDKLANDIWTMTLDPKGRVVVSGPGYLRMLVDDKNTGKATRAIDIGVELKDGAQGLFWEGEHLYYMADGGLRRVKVGDDGKATGPSELIRAMKTGGEHHAHAIKRGPDGWLYVLTGNTAGIDKTYANLPTSPIQEPTAGCVLRFTPDLKHSEIVADGLRNAYDMDFNLDGELFTFDSDNERCVALPWYEFIRFYHIIPGGHYGWVAPQHGTFWRVPPYSPDVVAPIDYFGRGSPTGVICYRHVQFPEHYRNGFFIMDWTFGRVYFVSLKHDGSSYRGTQEVFLQAVGDNGFAPTAGAVDPRTGDLYMSIGGRGTRGAVYRIRYPEGAKIDPAALAKMKIAPRSLEWKDDYLKQATTADAFTRLQALQAIRRHQATLPGKAVEEVIWANAGNLDPHVASATADLLAHMSKPDALFAAHPPAVGHQRATLALGQVGSNPSAAANIALSLIKDKEAEPAQRLAGARILQLALGGVTSPKSHGTVWEGYSPRKESDKTLRGSSLVLLRSAFPSGHADFDREVSRTLAILEDDDPVTLKNVADRLTETSPAVEDIHYLAVLARLKAPRRGIVTSKAASALLALDRKIVKEKLNRDRHWPLRLAEIQAELAVKDPKLNPVILAHEEFGRPDHALFARCPGFDRVRAAEVFLARAAKESEYPWNADLVDLVGVLPADKSFAPLRKLWSLAGLDEAILTVLAKHPEAADRDKFLFGLSSPQQATVRVSLEALEKLPGKDVEAKHILALVLALRRLGDTKEEKPLQERLGKYLAALTGQDKLGSDKKAWTDWFAKEHPALAGRLGGPDGVDVQAWGRRLAKIDWTKGEASRGIGIFTKASCASCHSGAQALGPDLRGVTGRFSRDDLLTAIVQPSKDIAARYRTTQIETADGKIYQGLVIYEAVDSMILQTGPAATIRLNSPQIVGKRFTDISLMPAGLLDPLKDEEIADLLAYLKSLGMPDKK